MLKHVKVFGHNNGFYTKTSSEDENIKREFCFKLKTNVQLDLFLLIKLKIIHVVIKMNCKGDIATH